MCNIVDTVEHRIQKAILTAIDNTFSPKIGLTFRSINASPGRDPTSVLANSERGEDIEISVPFEKVSERNNTLHVFSTNDETRINIPDDVNCHSHEHNLTGNHTLITVTPDPAKRTSENEIQKP